MALPTPHNRPAGLPERKTGLRAADHGEAARVGRLGALAIRPPWRDVPSTPHAPFLSSPTCRPSARSRLGSSSSFARALFALSHTYSIIGIVSSARPCSRAFAVPPRFSSRNFWRPSALARCAASAARSLRAATPAGQRTRGLDPVSVVGLLHGLLQDRRPLRAGLHHDACAPRTTIPTAAPGIEAATLLRCRPGQRHTGLRRRRPKRRQPTLPTAR